MNLRGLRESGTAFAIPTYGFIIVMVGMLLTGLFRIFVLGDELPRAERRPDHPGRAQRDRFRARVPAAADVLARAAPRSPASRRSPTACRRSRRRRARTPPPRCCCSAASRSSMLVGIIWLARLTHLQFVEDPATQIVAGPGGLRAEDRHHPARRDGLRLRVDPALRGRRGDRPDPVPGREHRVQRLPGARLDPRPGPLPAPPAAHPRRPAGVLQRHRLPGPLRDGADRRLPGRGDPADPALHRRACSCRSRCPRPA